MMIILEKKKDHALIPNDNAFSSSGEKDNDHTKIVDLVLSAGCSSALQPNTFRKHLFEFISGDWMNEFQCIDWRGHARPDIPFCREFAKQRMF